MFESKIRAVIIPQYEHERLAGVLARMWGNADFARPELPFDSFVAGVAFHDWHYGFADTHPIGGGRETDWIRLVQKGAEYRFEDPVTDVLVKLHIKRLLSGEDTPERRELVRLVEARINERVPESGFAREQFEWADKITRFCDRLAFEFSFEAPAEGTIGVYARPDPLEETKLQYRVKDGNISVAPWPFCTDTFGGVVIGYRQAGYPETLTPVAASFEVQRGTRQA